MRFSKDPAKGDPPPNFGTQCLIVGQVRKRTLDEFPHAEHTSFLAIIFGSDGYQSKNPSKKHAPGFRV